jgi:hypothetical protein
MRESPPGGWIWTVRREEERDELDEGNGFSLSTGPTPGV